MGLGDDIMFLGEAERIYNQTGKTIRPVADSGKSVFYKNVPWLYEGGEISVNARDTGIKTDIHIKYYEKGREKTSLGERMIFRAYQPKPFRVRLTYYEMDWARATLSNHNVEDQFLLINPDYKDSFYSSNKNWGFEKYQELTTMLSKDFNVVRVLPGGNYKEPPLKDAINIECEDVRKNVAIMSCASGAVGYDGLMNHVMAGFSIPMVVICGGLVDESIIGYETNEYIKYDHPQTPCGARYDCPHCLEANEKITVDMVYKKCHKLFYYKFL